MRIDITDKLQTEFPVLAINGKEYEVNNLKDTMLAFTQKLNEVKDTAHKHDIIDSAVKTFLGEAAFEEISKMRLTSKGYEKLFIAIMALANEEPYEDAESRFQKAGTQPGMV